MFSPAEAAACKRLIKMALAEDLGTAGDLTSQAVIPDYVEGQAYFVPRSAGVLAGLSAAESVFRAIDPRVTFQPTAEDGSRLQAGIPFASVSGPMRAILSGERIVLNFLQHLSGIASLTRRYVDTVAGLPAQIFDTRKTLPGWRLLAKYAVRCGGGHNHRLGLHDGILIKDNHLAALGRGPAAIEAAVTAARKRTANAVPVEIEVDSLEQLDTALACRPDVILLDNMKPDQLREAVRRRGASAPEVKLEASGGVTLDTVRAIAETGVDRISVGALTHSAPTLDIALDYLP
jgi:nicotinate-nucleotide pyrophosphorylase (carboxylating)